MTRPSNDDLLLAAEWLDVNEGEDGESAGCHRVADWLRETVRKRETAACVNELVKKTGASRKQVRAVLKNVVKQHDK